MNQSRRPLKPGQHRPLAARVVRLASELDGVVRVLEAAGDETAPAGQEARAGVAALAEQLRDVAWGSGR